MLYRFHKQFHKDIKKLDSSGKLQVADFLEQILESDDYFALHAKKIQGYKGFWRFRIGQYRVGVSKEKECIIFRRVLHRKDIYKKFP